MNDLIDRQVAIDALLHNQEIYSNNFGTDAIDKYTIAIIDNDVQTIAQLPSAQPERKKGKWITRKDVAPYRPDGEITSWTYKCGVCGSLSRLEYNYCPDCGTDMMERKEE